MGKPPTFACAVALPTTPCNLHTLCPSTTSTEVSNMGKYVLGWFLGVPVIVLVVVYFFMH